MFLKNVGLKLALSDIPRRTFFGWFDAAFNKYDSARVKEVGIDRAAAEWVLR